MNVHIWLATTFTDIVRQSGVCVMLNNVSGSYGDLPYECHSIAASLRLLHRFCHTDPHSAMYSIEQEARVDNFLTWLDQRFRDQIMNSLKESIERRRDQNNYNLMI